jgi:hypothetical protein
MARHGCLIVIVLQLMSCTSVEDVGVYWDKGVIDPVLEGSWKKIGLPGIEQYGLDIDDIPGADQLVFIKDGTSYAMRMVNPIEPDLPDHVAAQRKKDNATSRPVRTLRIGHGTFMMVIASESSRTGMLQRYEIKGDVLEEHNIDNGAAVDFLEAKYPNAGNIGRNRGEGRYVVIRTFDDEVLRILSEMAGVPSYWSLACQFRRMAPGP